MTVTVLYVKSYVIIRVTILYFNHALCTPCVIQIVGFTTSQTTVVCLIVIISRNSDREFVKCGSDSHDFDRV